MNIKNYTDIPFGTDSELMEEEISILDGFEAVIEGNKIILKKVECDDERVKNRLIKLIKMSSEVGGFALHKWEADEMLAWLEKQGEQKPTLPKWKYKKDNTTLLKDSLVLNKCGHMAKLSSGAIVSDVWVLDYDELAKLPKEELEEQGEQNPTDNVEPKFKVGDWVVSPNGVYWHIDAIQNGRYEVTADTGQYGNWSLNTNIYRLWTIQDAKDGDALFDGSNILLVKEVNHWHNVTSYLAYSQVYGIREYFISGSDVFTPATKEQRDLLFAKMKESGYEWDEENKELKKIEQKPTDKIRPKFKVGDRIIKSSRNSCPVHSSTDDTICEVAEVHDTCYILNTKDGRIQVPLEWQDSYELVKPAWSEEDEKRIKDIIYFLDTAKKHYASTVELDACINWLKSLRPQNRDTYNPYKEVVSSIAEMCDKYKSFSDDRANDFVNNVKVKCKDAKEYDSIYPQNTWLPSDEQMESLEQFISEYKDIDDSNRAYPISHIIESLYNDLKKLKGE